MNPTQSYYTRLALQEAARASRTRSPSARQWHLELADKFARQAAEAGEGAPMPQLAAA